MKKIALTSLFALSFVLNADVIPSINSKGGAMTLPEGKLKMSIKHISFDRNSMFDGSHEAQNSQKLDATANITILGLKYGLSDRVSLAMVVPHKSISATATLGTNAVAIKNEGLGDIVLALRYAMVKNSDFSISFDSGVKLPTGSTNGSFKTAPVVANGSNTPMPTQMGTGEFEYKVGSGVSYIINDDLRFDINLAYTHRPKAQNSYDFGDEISFVLGATKSVINQVNIGVDYILTHNTHTSMGSDTNTQLRAMLPFKAFSGTTGYITPQIEFLPFSKPKIHFGAGVSFLANYDLSEYQPLEKKRVIFNMGYMF